MRDDIDKLPLPKSAKRYARMKSGDLGANWSKKVDMFMDMAADLTNQSKEGFKNRDAAGKVTHAFKESYEDMLGDMGSVASRPFLYKRALKAFQDRLSRNDDSTAAVSDALAAVGALNPDGSKIRVSPLMPLGHFLELSIRDRAFVEVERLLRKYASMLSDDAIWALMQVFQEEAGNMYYEDLGGIQVDSIVGRLLDNPVYEAMYDYDGFRGWVSPSGEKFEITDGSPHGGQESVELLQQFYPSWDWESNPNFIVGGTSFPAYALQFRGWVRVVGDGIYSTWKIDGQTYSTLIELIREVLQEDPEAKIVVDVHTGRPIHGYGEDVLHQLGESIRLQAAVSRITEGYES